MENQVGNRAEWEANFFWTLKLTLGCLAIGGTLMMLNGLQETLVFLKQVFHPTLRVFAVFTLLCSFPYLFLRHRVQKEIKERNNNSTLLTLLLVAFALTVLMASGHLAYIFKLTTGGNILVVVAFFFFFCATLLCALMWKIHTTHLKEKSE